MSVVSLSPLSAATPSRMPPPPRGFRPIEGGVRQPQFTTLAELDKSGTYAQRAGMRYEEKVHSYIRGLQGYDYLANQPLKFFDATGMRFCVPDGLILLDKFTVIVEIKFQHMIDAWYQLRQLYEPVVAALNRDVETRVLEICRSFDPATPFPEPVHLVEDFREYLRNPYPAFSVFRWK